MRRFLAPIAFGVGLPAAFAATVVAQVGAPVQTNPIERLAPVAPPRVAPSVEGPPLVAQTGPGAAQRIRVGAATVSGNEAVPAGRFATALAALAGQEVTLAQIEETRIAILSAYRAEGYPFAAVDAGLTPRAGGTADAAFRITEGYIAEVRLEGDIGPAGTQVLRFLEPLTRQRPLTGAALERALLLASDIPGVSVRGVVRPMTAEPGALQLVAQVSRRPFGGYLNLDNRGSNLAGPWQGLLAFGANAFTEYGERSELAVFSAEGGQQDFAQGTFEAFIGGSGLRARAWAGAGRARPGSALAAIGYAGDTQVFGAALTYPVIRTRPFTLTTTGQFDGLESEVRTDTGGGSSVASRDSVRSLRAGFEMQALDTLIPFLPPAVTSGQVRLHHGLSGFGASANGDAQATRTGSRFDYLKASFEATRVMPLFEPVEGWTLGLQGHAAGQYSNDVLPQVEKFYLGGSRINRGFYAGQVTGDTAFAYGVELQLSTRFELPGEAPWGLSNRLDAQFYLFRDQGRSWENVATDPNRRLVSYGLGVRLNLSEALALELEGVRRQTRRPAGQAEDPLDRDAVYFRSLVRF
ncbi:ShlB/FhaC/HecB family hemolysin secretion/activation protein [Falsiroseomonas sp. CW058]|uniref:ShlB/FhaC/HecB family hemolysin secretion/activation protein n=1 Tax=Falsiroseomonas sp. CW058 TaxID=3388664 RepID=UPI003D31AD25